jgi:photosystem II stability/assembly factor-like uncharacterized protein
MKRILCTLGLAVSIFTAHAQWTQTSAGGGSDITAHNGKLFALTTSQQLIVSTNNGGSWSDVTTDTLEGRPDFLASAGNRLYVATYNVNNAHGLIYYSTDDGASWTLDTVGMPNALLQPPGKGDVRKLLSYDGDRLVANFGGVDAYCTKRTTDAAWTVMTDLASHDPDHYITKGDSLMAIGTGAIIKYSTNGGQSFSDISSTGLPSAYAPTCVHRSTTGRIYMALNLFIQQRTALFYSDDFGATWDSLNIYSYVKTNFVGQRQTITALFSRGNAVYMAFNNDKSNTTADIFRSDNAGQTFVKDTVGLKIDNFPTEQVLRFYEHDNRLFSVHNNTDIHYTNLGGAPIGLAEHREGAIRIYPNPTTADIYFSEGVHRVQVYGVNGVLYFEEKDTVDALQLQRIPKGMYIIVFTDQGGSKHQQRLLIQ